MGMENNIKSLRPQRSDKMEKRNRLIGMIVIDDLIDAMIVFDKFCSVLLDEHRDVRVWKMLLENLRHREGKDNVPYSIGAND